ncbi:MAG: nucleotidyltransferase domain-containing protein, partial [Tannerella sp.]|nr:nucleotidyltransferase domain-containing protein [Tannerella sp.]
MDKRDDIINLVRQFKQLVAESKFPMQIEKVYLFGSYAKDTPQEHSDIDVAFIVATFKGNFFKIIPPLWKLRRQIDFRIEPHVVARDTDYAG